MPIEYALNGDGSVVMAKASGRVTTAEMLAYLDALEADPGLGPIHSTIFDARGVSEMAFDGDHFERIARRERRNPGKLMAKKLAFVVGDIDAFKASVKWIRHAESFKESTMVFHDLLSARTWLGIRR